MNIDLKKGTVTLYEVKCSLCGEKIRSPEKGGCRELLSSHIDNDCKTVKQMREWEKQGVCKEMMGLLRLQGLDKDLKKLLKHYSFEEIKDAIERLEIEAETPS